MAASASRAEVWLEADSSMLQKALHADSPQSSSPYSHKSKLKPAQLAIPLTLVLLLPAFKNKIKDGGDDNEELYFSPKH